MLERQEQPLKILRGYRALLELGHVSRLHLLRQAVVLAIADIGHPMQHLQRTVFLEHILKLLSPLAPGRSARLSLVLPKMARD